MWGSPGSATAASAAAVGAPDASPAADVGCTGAVSQVRDAAGLTAALASAKPGDVIQLADGVYRGSFAAKAQGTPDRPITLCGSRNAVITGDGAGYPLHLDSASYWRVAGFTIRGGQKGLVADHAQGNVIEGLLIEQIGQEGLHLRAASTNNTVRDNEIRQTGLTSPQFGEGIYVGSAQKNWARFGAGGPDRSDRNAVENNKISDTTAECVDIKEGTTGGTLRANTFSGRALAGGFADSWVDVKGNDWTIADNVGTDSKADGFQVHQVVAGWGVGNTFRNNMATLNGTGLAINITGGADRNQVFCDNRVAAGRALSNVACLNPAAGRPAPASPPAPVSQPAPVSPPAPANRPAPAAPRAST
jgi:parallel beta helix pectate lyase-like protein